MTDSDVRELKSEIYELRKDVSRILSWAQGDKDLGTPSVQKNLENINNSISQTRSVAFDNQTQIKLIKKQVDGVGAKSERNMKEISDIKKTATIMGGSSGSFFTIMIQTIWAAMK